MSTQPEQSPMLNNADQFLADYHPLAPTIMKASLHYFHGGWQLTGLTNCKTNPTKACAVIEMTAPDGVRPENCVDFGYSYPYRDGAFSVDFMRSHPLQARWVTTHTRPVMFGFDVLPAYDRECVLSCLLPGAIPQACLLRRLLVADAIALVVKRGQYRSKLQRPDAIEVLLQPSLVKPGAHFEVSYQHPTHTLFLRSSPAAGAVIFDCNPYGLQRLYAVHTCDGDLELTWYEWKPEGVYWFSFVSGGMCGGVPTVRAHDPGGEHYFEIPVDAFVSVLGSVFPHAQFNPDATSCSSPLSRADELAGMPTSAGTLLTQGPIRTAHQDGLSSLHTAEEADRIFARRWYRAAQEKLGKEAKKREADAAITAADDSTISPATN